MKIVNQAGTIVLNGYLRGLSNGDWQYVHLKDGYLSATSPGQMTNAEKQNAQFEFTFHTGENNKISIKSTATDPLRRNSFLSVSNIGPAVMNRPYDAMIPLRYWSSSRYNTIPTYHITGDNGYNFRIASNGNVYADADIPNSTEFRISGE